jgi:hypothetical protein
MQSMATLQIHCDYSLQDEAIALRDQADGREVFPLVSGLTACVLTIATNFHHVRLLGLFAILATVFAAFLWRAIAGRMGAFGFVILCHKTFPAFSLVRA